MKKIWWTRKSTQIIRALKSKKNMKLFNFWSWPAELIDDIRVWGIVRKAIKEESTKAILSSYKYQIRVDKLGRLYTVINVPEEFYPEDKQKLVWAWMVEQLRELDSVLMQCQLNEFVYPEVERVQDPQSFAYLVILSPPSESLSVWKFLTWILNTGLTIGTIIVINNLVQYFTGNSIVELLSIIFK